ncbi:MAG: glycosidase, partial [Candidatus Omnitrophica bacterium]|nr:glycosidase [Candidatus Omnitrophota bacterium]
MANFRSDLLRRWSRNPIISLEDIPYPCNTVFNGAVTKFKDKYIMLLRVEDRKGHSVVVKAQSEDGYHFVVEKKPCLFPNEKEPFKTYETRGVEDP